jgi:hypothetical protein
MIYHRKAGGAFHGCVSQQQSYTHWLDGAERAVADWRLIGACLPTVGYISKKCHIPNFENQERASQILMIHHNLTKGAV